jgi:TRAP-type C4-dicarboxylate transport system permease small subunit
LRPAPIDRRKPDADGRYFHLLLRVRMLVLERFIARLSALLCFVAGVALLWMMAQVTLDAIMRYIFNSPLPGTVEIISAYHMMIVVFFPLAYVTRRGGQIVATMFTQGLPPRVLDGLERAINVLSIAVLIAIIWMTGREAIFRTIEGEAWDAGDVVVSVWPSRWVAPLGCALMALYLAIDTVAPRRARHY